MELKLDNGVTVITEKTENLRSASLGVYVAGGSAAEPPELAGLAHYAEHMAFKGTHSRTSAQIAQQFDAMGGYVNAYTAKELTCFYARALDTHVPSCLDLLSDMVLHPRNDATDVATEKKVIIEEIAMCEDTPEDLVSARLAQSVWPDSPLGREILGTSGTVNRVDSAALESYGMSRFTGNNIYICASGKIDEAAFADDCRRLFGSRLAGERICPPAPALYRPAVTLTEKDIEQNHICIAFGGLPREDGRRYAMSLLSLLLGGGMSSRLWRAVREEKGLAYSVQTYTSSYIGAGLFCVYTALASESQAECLRVIRGILDDVKRSGFTAEELSRGAEQLKSGIILDLESTSSRMKFLAKKAIFGDTEADADAIVARIDAVTGADLVALAGDILDYGSISMSVVGAPESESFYRGFFE